MKKMSTLFLKDPNDLGRVIDKVNPENQWVFTAEGVKATRKFDGTSCAIIDGKLYKRYDAKLDKKAGRAKPERPIPDGAIECCPPDPKSGHWPHWVPCDRNNPSDKYHWEAFDSLLEDNKFFGADQIGYKGDGTYELCGPKIQGNPENFDSHVLVRHGSEMLHIEASIQQCVFDAEDQNVELGVILWNHLRWYLGETDIEGIVFHHPENIPNNPSNRYCKLRKSDFGLER